SAEASRRIGPCGLSRWKVDVFIQTDRRKSLIQILRLDPGVPQLQHDRIGRRQGSRHKVPPRLLPEKLILHLVEFGEAGRHARFDWSLAQKPATERVDSPRKEALQVGKSFLNAGNAFD